MTGGGKVGPHLRGRQREKGLAFARRWREANRAYFDTLDARGSYSDSVPVEWPIAAGGAK